MSARDYYEVLGVPRTAKADEIRSAYRKLARQLHPDVNKAPDAQRKFTEVQNAYDVLSDDKKRAMYDQFGSAAFETGAAQEAASRARTGPHYSWSNAGGPRPGGSVNVNGVNFDPEDINSIFESVFGGGFGRADGAPSGAGRKKTRRGRAAPVQDPIEHELEVPFEIAARGGVQTLRLTTGGAGKTVEVTIPAGIESDRQLRIRGGAAEPDVLLRIKVSPHRWFRRGEHEETGKGLDLFVDLPLSIAEATLGAKVTIPTLDGSVELAIPPGSPSGRKLRLRGKGIRDSSGRIGDLFGIVKIVPPSGATLTPTEAEQLLALAAKAPVHRPW